MGRFLIAVGIAAVSVSSALAGVTYDFRSATTGLQNTTLSGTVEIEGPSLRMNVKNGDGVVIKNDALILSKDGGQTLMVFDPGSKTFFELPVDAMFGAAGILGPNSMVKLSFDNVTAATKDEGDAGMLEGFPVRKATTEAGCDISIDAMGSKMKMHVAMSTESWTTDRLSIDFMNIFQGTGRHTGIEGLDKMIDAQSGAMRGRFPLKQVTTVRMKQGDADLVNTTTTTVSNVQQKPVPASEFAPPAGYTKTDNPMDQMMKRVNAAQ